MDNGISNGDFIIYYKYEDEQFSLSYVSHSVERIDPNKFIIYDNDYLNLTDYLSLNPRYVDLLPGNTRIGTFGAGGSTDNDYITEVNEAGDIAWEIAINGTDTYRVERFYASPLIKVDAATLNSTKRDNAIII